MEYHRIIRHPILSINQAEEIPFYWKDEKLIAHKGETIATALFAHGIRIFGHHQKDGSPQGIFCANGQCSQCMVIANGKPVKSCMELVEPGLKVLPMEGLPVLPKESAQPVTGESTRVRIPVLIIGGGPAGISAAIELGQQGIDTIIVDDKHRLGGKLVLQTHRFFGSTNAVYAGTRGIDIARRLEKEVSAQNSVQIWLNSSALAVFSDKKVGILKEGKKYVVVEPEILLVSSGAREKFLTFKGNTLPGVYGAGAFQTLVNRDMVKPTEKLFIIGGGNVGLIAGYHALQAGIEVVGLAEALPECGGYKVHKDKLARLGVPIYTSHTVISANGEGQVSSVTIAQVDQKFNPIPGTEKTFACDTVLLAVGLDSVNEFYLKAKEFGMNVFVAGDAEEIAEASAAMFSGKICGSRIAKALGYQVPEIPPDWLKTAEILKSKPGNVSKEEIPEVEGGVEPIIHCTQEIPCNPCASVCPQGMIFVDKNDIRKLPSFLGDNYCCIGCAQCVLICPGLAITLVDYRDNPQSPMVTIPYEIIPDNMKAGDVVSALDTEGNILGNVEISDIEIKVDNQTNLIRVTAPKEIANKIAGIQPPLRQAFETPGDQYQDTMTGDMIACRCERVTVEEIRSLIRQGYRDINEIKTVTRAGMGACGGKTCTAMITRIFREEGLLDEATEPVRRPLFIETPLGTFADVSEGKETK